MTVINYRKQQYVVRFVMTTGQTAYLSLAPTAGYRYAFNSDGSQALRFDDPEQAITAARGFMSLSQNAGMVRRIEHDDAGNPICHMCRIIISEEVQEPITPLIEEEADASDNRDNP